MSGVTWSPQSRALGIPGFFSLLIAMAGFAVAYPIDGSAKLISPDALEVAVVFLVLAVVMGVPAILIDARAVDRARHRLAESGITTVGTLTVIGRPDPEDESAKVYFTYQPSVRCSL